MSFIKAFFENCRGRDRIHHCNHVLNFSILTLSSQGPFGSIFPFNFWPLVITDHPSMTITLPLREFHLDAIMV